jgi:hypothetical protein
VFLGNGARAPVSVPSSILQPPPLLCSPLTVPPLAAPPLAVARAPRPAARRSTTPLAGCSPAPRPPVPLATAAPARAPACCSVALPPPAARAPRHSRLLGRPATAARRFTVSSLQVITSGCLYLFFLLNILTSESQLILNRRKLCQLG